MGINGPCVSEIVIVPYIVQNLLSREGNPLVLGEIGQKLEFLVAELDFFTVDFYLMRRLVDADSPGVDDLSGIQRIDPS